MKKQLLLFVLVLLPIVASADAVEIDGIYYNLVTKANQAEVTSHPTRYTGNVDIPETVSYEGVEYRVTSIAPYAFSSCSGLTSITIPNSVTSIGYAAFLSCKSLTSITIPNSIARIEGSVFAGCSSLTSVTIPNSVRTIDTYAFEFCSSLASITLPNSVTYIGAGTFEGCSSLTSITIPNGVRHIFGETFRDCSSLASVTIGTGMKSIIEGSFARCPELKDVYCLAEKVPNTSSNAFEGSYIEYATLHVPDGSVNLYSNAEPWKNFKKIVALDGSTPASQKCEKPSITYQNGQLKVTCATEGAQFVTEITDVDIKKHYDATISLTATYNVSAYATKPGYEDSDVCSLTLCWIDQAPAISTGTVQVPAAPVIIRNDGGLLTIQGADDGTTISVFNVDGRMVGSTTSQIGEAIVDTNLQPGSIAIIKIGSKSLKFVVK